MTFLRTFLNLNKWIRILILFILIWGLTVFIFIIKLQPQMTSEISDENTMKRLNQAISYLEQSRQRNSDIKELINELLK